MTRRLFLACFMLAGITCFAQTTVIGSLTWDSKNLSVKKFRNGDKIGEARTTEEWLKAAADKTPAWCYYNNDVANEKTYGILYNYYAVKDPRGIAPTGWRVPTKNEWIDAGNALGGLNVAAKEMKSSTLWTAVADVDRNGTNSSGLNITPAGLRFPDGKFDALGTYAHYWSATLQNSDQGQGAHFGISSSIVIGHATNPFGYSVRLVKE